MANNKNQHWAHFQEAGTLYGFHFLLWLYRVFGRGFFSIILWPVMLYFMLMRKAARHASTEFLQAHYQAYPQAWDSPPNRQHVLKHLYQFGQVILDKLLGWTEDIREDDFRLLNEAKVRELLDDSRGQLIIGSHFGNLEYCRGFMQRNKHKVINILVYEQHSANFAAVMKHINANSRLNIYQVTELDVATLLMFKTKIDNGEWVFIAGDRVPVSGDTNTTTVNFLGRSAPLPVGPYMLAKVLQCPVQLMFAYRHAGKVNFSVETLTEKLTIDRKNREADLQSFAQAFASALEAHCAVEPFQWFNFYPFWNE